MISYIGWETPFIRVWKPFPTRRVSKALRGSPKGKAQRRQYLLVVGLGLGRYKWYQSQTPDYVPARRCASKDAGPQGGWIWRGSHIDWRKERVPTRTLGLKGGGLWYPTLVGEENETPFIRVWKPFPSRRVLKAFKRTRKGKPKEDNTG